MLIAKSHFALVFGSSIFFHNIYAAFFEEVLPAAFPFTPRILQSRGCPASLYMWRSRWGRSS